MNNNAAALPRAVIDEALRAGVTIATAESLTAGMVAAELATVPGASGTLRGGVVAYHNEVKEEILGVDHALLESEGSVDGGVAVQMAEGARRVCSADIAVSTTGAAGPEPHDGKAVGTVFIAVATASGVMVEDFSFDGGRQNIRQLACDAALEALRVTIAGHAAGTNDLTQ